MFIPQLLTSAAFGELDGFIRHPDWYFQEKMDGIRCAAIISADDVDVEFVTRGGKPLVSTAVTPMFPELTRELLKIYVPDRELILDGELIPSENRFYIFDIPSDKYTFRERMDALDEMFQDIDSNMLFEVPLARTEEEKQQLFESVITRHGEGLVAKHRDCYYDEGDRVTHSVKLKFTRTVDLVVMDKNRGESSKSIRGGLKQNYVVGYPDGHGMKEVANVSAIGREPMEIGDIVEVEYLYVGNKGRLVQPRIIQARPDKSIGDISVDQFIEYELYAIPLATKPDPVIEDLPMVFDFSLERGN